jgi:hypothetical protein
MSRAFVASRWKHRLRNPRELRTADLNWLWDNRQAQCQLLKEKVALLKAPVRETVKAALQLLRSIGQRQARQNVDKAQLLPTDDGAGDPTVAEAL